MIFFTQVMKFRQRAAPPRIIHQLPEYHFGVCLATRKGICDIKYPMIIYALHRI